MPKNIGASVRARLLNIARQRDQVFDVVLTMFVLERLLFRLSDSRFSDRFVLKGAMLLATWLPDFHRVTRDLDLLGYGSSVPEEVAEIFCEVAGIKCPDGVEFDVEGIRVEQIREEQDYGGLRLRTTATLSDARIPVIVDIGFGDAVVPGLRDIEYPALLDFPAPKIRAYAPETVVAGKFQAMVVLGRVNSRMKDFYDVWMLSRTFDFNRDSLAQAIASTFRRRGTEIPVQLPDALTRNFSLEPIKVNQWRSFTEDLAVTTPDLSTVVKDLAGFLMPAAVEATSAGAKALDELARRGQEFDAA